MNTCTHCPCKISRESFVCAGCARGAPAHHTLHDGIFCVFCHHEICAEHADPRALAQHICQTCLSRAEDLSFEEGEDEEEGSMLFDDDESDADDDHRHMPPLPRLLPDWMRPTRHTTPHYYTPDYCRPDATPTHTLAATAVAADVAVRDTCSICLENFSSGETVTRLSCHISHMFHTPCIDTWRSVARTCPLCKKT